MSTERHRDGLHVVVVGATGNVGTSVLDALVADLGVDRVTALARRAPVWMPAEIDFTTCDITTDDLTDHIRGADVVIHLAWTFQPTHDAVTT